LTDIIAIPGISTPVSRVALGTWAIGGWLWGGADDEKAVATIHHALDQGVNLIDTAPIYGFGHSEEVVGEALTGRRSQAVIATKVGLEWIGDGKKFFRNSERGRIKKEVEDSLRRLKMDYIDLEQIHWPDPQTPIEETARALEDLVRDGKILALGVSNFTTVQMDEFRKFAPLTSVQPPYNLFDRDIENNILPYAERNNLAVLVYGPLCRGLLSGRMSADTKFDGDDLRNIDPKFKAPRFQQYLKAAAALERLAREKHNKSLLALAVRWVLDKGPTIALWGARKPDQVSGIRDAFGWRLDAQDMQEIDAILAKYVLDPVGPEFMAPPSR
jgi:aryl-alcohol dehydrogenase-like predicted oxidoreductase